MWKTNDIAAAEYACPPAESMFARPRELMACVCRRENEEHR